VRIVVLILGGIVLGVCVASAQARGRGSERLALVGRFESPVYATAVAGEVGRLYVVEQQGKIVVIVNGKERATPFLDISRVVKSGGEQGLLSMAFDPEYGRNHLFYVDYTDANGDTRVVRYRSDGRTAILSSRKLLLFVKDFAPNHNGGQLQFGPDGRLYWGNGDGGGGGDPGDNGQSLARPFAKLESLDIRARGARWKIVAYGLRNPWRFSFDSSTGDLYIGDVGQDSWEEIDYLAHDQSGLINFGWRRYEGTHVYDASMPLSYAGRYVPPIVTYPHSDGCSVTGGYVYRGTELPGAVGRYFYGDYCSGTIWSLKVVAGRATDLRPEPFTVSGLSSFGQGVNGELYLVSAGTGAVYRLSGS
jgi:glucose/arabinose dehydrogenase